MHPDTPKRQPSDTTAGGACAREPVGEPSYERASDGELVAATMAGDSKAFEVIAKRYQGALWRAAFSRIGSREGAEEVLQETFLCAFRYLASYDSLYSFRTWLWSILLNQCRRYVRHLRRTPLVSTWTDHVQELTYSSASEPLSEESSPPAQLDAAEKRELLERQLARLPEAQADALRLRFFGGLKFEEIAIAMGCSLGTAKNRVKWGLLKVAGQLSLDHAAPSEDDDEIRREL